jgi:hypothetical protein
VAVVDAQRLQIREPAIQVPDKKQQQR